MWNLSSRIHHLNHFPNQGVSCYVKRDDELGCGISGSKLRKYASLLPYLLDKNIRHLIIIGGAQSNNLLAALQIAREFQFNLTAFLIKPRSDKIQGNFKLSRLFFCEEEIRWIPREDWPKVDELAELFLANLKETGFIISEGASVAEAMPGAESIATDILANEIDASLKFQHIFIDAGTGFSAAALINGLLKLEHEADIHVLLLADDEMTFKSKLLNWIGLIPKNLHCFIPPTAKSFGSVNQIIQQEIKRLAQEEGILADPIYSAKLFYSARQRIESERLKGNILIIHSGGTLTMAGFDF
ncbi:MAG: 1-aminocyclopropane-1-carboxylate deaminase [Tatlockia sp.]|nr:1-aminocyclopropane-1-carboxylate deaminase [Tatlockia sp.]